MERTLLALAMILTALWAAVTIGSIFGIADALLVPSSFAMTILAGFFAGAAGVRGSRRRTPTRPLERSVAYEREEKQISFLTDAFVRDELDLETFERRVAAALRREAAPAGAMNDFQVYGAMGATGAIGSPGVMGATGPVAGYDRIVAAHARAGGGGSGAVVVGGCGMIVASAKPPEPPEDPSVRSSY